MHFTAKKEVDWEVGVALRKLNDRLSTLKVSIYFHARISISRQSHVKVSHVKVSHNSLKSLSILEVSHFLKEVARERRKGIVEENLFKFVSNSKCLLSKISKVIV